MSEGKWKKLGKITITRNILSLVACRAFI